MYKGKTKMHLYSFKNNPITLLFGFPVHGIFERVWHKCLNKIPGKEEKNQLNDWNNG